ncbi:MAG: hypothetical protein WC508_05365 [Patescibacteria group bacterium]
MKKVKLFFAKLVAGIIFFVLMSGIGAIVVLPEGSVESSPWFLWTVAGAFCLLLAGLGLVRYINRNDANC